MRPVVGHHSSSSAVTPAQFQPPERRVLQGEHHLEQRIETEVALRLQFIHQPLERQVLMPVGVERGAPDALERRRKRQALPRRSIRSASVLTKNPISGSRSRGDWRFADRRADDEVVLPAVAMQQRWRSRPWVINSVASRSPVSGGAARRKPPLAGEVGKADAAAPVRLRGRAGSDRSARSEHRRSVVQLAPPVAELGLQHRVAEQPVALPDGEVGILDLRQHGQQRRRHPGRMRGCSSGSSFTSTPSDHPSATMW